MSSRVLIAHRDVLIAHLDGQGRPAYPQGAHNNITRTLVTRGWLRVEKPAPMLCKRGHWIDGGRGLRTFITDAGREVLARALADWADALMLAQARGLQPRPAMPDSRETLANTASAP